MVPGYFPGHKSTLANWITAPWQDYSSNSLFPSPWFQIRWHFQNMLLFWCWEGAGSLREEEGQGSGGRESWRSELQQLWQSCAGLAVLQDTNRLSTGRTVGSQDGDSRCYRSALKSISSISCAPIASTWFFFFALFYFLEEGYNSFGEGQLC